MKKLILLGMLLFLVKLDSSFVVCDGYAGGMASGCRVLKLSDNLESTIKDLKENKVNWPSDVKFNIMNATNVLSIK